MKRESTLTHTPFRPWNQLAYMEQNPFFSVISYIYSFPAIMSQSENDVKKMIHSVLDVLHQNFCHLIGKPKPRLLLPPLSIIV